MPEGPAHLCDFFTLEIEHPARQIPVGSVPECVDTEHLNIDAVFVHVRDPLRCNRKAKISLKLPACRSLEWGAFDNVEHGRHGTVRVNIHGLDPAAVYSDLAARWHRGRLRERMSEAAADANHASRCARGISQKSSPIEHVILPTKRGAKAPMAVRCNVMSLYVGQRIAIGATAEPVAPLIFSGCTIKANS